MIVDDLLFEVKAEADQRSADIIGILFSQIDNLEIAERKRLSHLRDNICDFQYERELYFAVKKMWIHAKRIFHICEHPDGIIAPCYVHGDQARIIERECEDLEIKVIQLNFEWKKQRRRYKQFKPCGLCHMCQMGQKELWKNTKFQKYYERKQNVRQSELSERFVIAALTSSASGTSASRSG